MWFIFLLVVVTFSQINEKCVTFKNGYIKWKNFGPSSLEFTTGLCGNSGWNSLSFLNGQDSKTSYLKLTSYQGKYTLSRNMGFLPLKISNYTIQNTFAFPIGLYGLSNINFQVEKDLIKDQKYIQVQCSSTPVENNTLGFVQFSQTFKLSLSEVNETSECSTLPLNLRSSDYHYNTFILEWFAFVILMTFTLWFRNSFPFRFRGPVPYLSLICIYLGSFSSWVKYIFPFDWNSSKGCFWTMIISFPIDLVLYYIIIIVSRLFLIFFSIIYVI